MSTSPVIESPHIIEVIRCRLERRGSGKDKSSPIRIIDQFYAKDGALLMERDPSAIHWTPEMTESVTIDLLKTAESPEQQLALEAVIKKYFTTYLVFR